LKRKNLHIIPNANKHQRREGDDLLPVGDDEIGARDESWYDLAQIDEKLRRERKKNLLIITLMPLRFHFF